MGDAGDGEGFQGQQGGDAAADVHKGTVGFQVGDGGGQDVPQLTLQQLRQRPFLCQAPGELWDAVCKAGDHKTHRLAHAGEDGDVPCTALSDAQGALLPWDDSHRVPQLHRQSVSGVTAEGKPFQDDLLPPGGLQTGSAG